MTSTSTDAAANEHEAAVIAATARLTFARRQHPGLKAAEARARLALAAAVMAMDEAFDSGSAAIAEQFAVEEAKDEYAQALADLIRGESPDVTKA